MSQNPKDSDVRRLYGQFLEAQGKQSQAVAEYEKLVEADAADPIALNNLAWQYAMENRSGAVELAEKAHRLAPENGSITDTYGWILHLQGDYERALAILERALRQSPDNADVKFHLAATYAKLGNKTRARAILTDLLETNSAFPSRAEAEEIARRLRRTAITGSLAPHCY